MANLRKRFRGIEVLSNVSLAVPTGQVTALIGSNGAGKSTLLNIVSGLIAPDAGQIRLAGQDITRLAPHIRARLGLARTFQHPRSFRTLSVFDSVRFAATPPAQETVLRGLRPAWGKSRAAADTSLHDRVLDCLRQCALESRADVPAAELSYGEQKLLMLAQVLAPGSRLLCFDELCAGLEPALIEQVKAAFRSLVAQGKSILFIEHNLQLVRSMADHVVFLHQGAIFREGAAQQVLADPEVVRLYLGH